jgi:hypothetical protein
VDSPIDGYKYELEGLHVDDDAVETENPPALAGAVEIACTLTPLPPPPPGPPT